MPKALAGIRVADFSHIMAGPFGSHFLTLLGALLLTWLAHFAPEKIVWLAPIWLPLLLAIPISRVMSSMGCVLGESWTLLYSS